MNLSYANLGDAFAYESITVSSSAIGCTAATYAVDGERSAVAALITAETAESRFRIDGSDPTSYVGHVLSAGDSIVLTAPNIASLKLIRTGGSDATVRVTYFR